MKSLVLLSCLGLATSVFAAPDADVTPPKPAADATAAKAPIVIDAPAKWDVKYTGEKGVSMFTLKCKDNGTVLMMITKWPVPGGKDDVTKYLDQIAKGFVTAIKKNPKVKLDSEDYEQKPIEGDVFSGKFVSFKMQAGITQEMFMLSDGKEMWNGQYTGTEDGWKEALEIVKKIKRP